MSSYDAANFDPPAPIANVTLRNRVTGAMVGDVLMLIDTGADVTLIPLSAIERLGISGIEKRYALMGFDGAVTHAPAVALELAFLGRNFRGQFLGIEQEFGILGRNVLNVVTLLLDGPNERWESAR